MRPRPGSCPINTQLCVYLRKILVASNSFLLPLRHFSSCFQFSPVRIPLLYANFCRYMQPRCTFYKIHAFDKKLEQISCPSCYLSNFNPKQQKSNFQRRVIVNQIHFNPRLCLHAGLLSARSWEGCCK